MIPMAPGFFRPQGDITDPYGSNVELLIHFDGDFLDYSLRNRTVTAWTGGAPVASSGTGPFGQGSFKFDGSANTGLVVGDAVGLQFGTSTDFTIEGWINVDARSNAQGNPAPMGIATKRVVGSNSTNYWALFVHDTTTNPDYAIRMEEGSTGGAIATRDASEATALDTWHYFAVTRETVGGVNTMRFYFGTLGDATADKVYEGATTHSYDGNSANLYIGVITSLMIFNGWMSDFRITKGVARYVGATAPMPTAKFPDP